MSILESLNSAYARMVDRGEVPPFGYSYEKVGFLISLDEDGRALSVTDLREGDGKKKRARLMPVPQQGRRTSAVAPNLLWDKTSYALGLTAGGERRLTDKHAAFVKRHEQALKDCEDIGLQALLRFLRLWAPEHFASLGWPEEMKDKNVVFALESERLQGICIHDRPAARALWAKILARGDKAEAICLVSGEKAPVARLHPAIKGVWGAQPSGGSIVSFNLDAFESYDHEQGDNAPISETAAFAYTSVLNRFLSKDSGHRIQIGDASTVFWADGSGAEVAEGIFSAMFDGVKDEVDEHSEAKKVGSVLDALREGGPLDEVAPALAQGVRFFVLGLAPNAARLSIRFWFEDDFGVLARNYQRFLEDMKIAPRSEFEEDAPVWRYLLETATLGKRENVPPKLAGEWLRSILTGTTFPLTLLSTVLMRMRADRKVNAFRVAMVKAVLVRNYGMTKEASVALDPENRSKGYLLGRLFAIYEQTQAAALGRNVNSTIKDKFYGSASGQPRTVFPYLEKNSAHHLSKLGKQKPGCRIHLEKALTEIMELMSPADDPFPTFLSAKEQALFGLGYYHQRSEFFKPKHDQVFQDGEAA